MEKNDRTSVERPTYRRSERGAKAEYLSIPIGEPVTDCTYCGQSIGKTDLENEVYCLLDA
jgi:hypothetical protein